MRARRSACCFVVGLSGLWLGLAAPACHALEPATLGVVINEADPQSVAVGTYYAKQRHIPEKNVIRIRFESKGDTFPAEQFEKLLTLVHIKTPPTVQAYALSWTTPYRVDCMSITSAFTFGFARRYCASSCEATAPSPYFNADSTRPQDDFRIRPTMMIAAQNAGDAQRLIDRGVSADDTHPDATAYLVTTKDKARSTRSPSFPVVQQNLSMLLPIRVLRTEGIRDRSDVMFYFTGTAQVPYLGSLGFLPGAIADHLTSAGGVLFGTTQMSALRWLEAGATGSYGTVVEPCNFPQKFPNPGIVIERYLAGETLLEAYWKSVVWPGQGLFIGEPLARPYSRQD